MRTSLLSHVGKFLYQQFQEARVKLCSGHQCQSLCSFTSILQVFDRTYLLVLRESSVNIKPKYNGISLQIISDGHSIFLL